MPAAEKSPFSVLSEGRLPALPSVHTEIPCRSSSDWSHRQTRSSLSRLPECRASAAGSENPLSTAAPALCLFSRQTTSGSPSHRLPLLPEPSSHLSSAWTEKSSETFSGSVPLYKASPCCCHPVSWHYVKTHKPTEIKQLLQVPHPRATHLRSSRSACRCRAHHMPDNFR